MDLTIDLETKSGASIRDVGLFRYADDPEFEILLLAYKYDNEETKLIRLNEGEPVPVELRRDLIDPNITKHAFNAAFEITCLNQAGYHTDVRQWECSMAHALYAGYPGSLAGVGKAIGLPEEEQKMKVGKSLIQYFCVPQKPTKTNGGRRWNLPEHDPEKAELFGTYCKQDVDTEHSIDQILTNVAPWPDREKILWRLDYLMNLNGIPLDKDLAYGAIECDEQASSERLQEAQELTGLNNPKSNAQLLPWLNERLSEPLENLQKATVADALNGNLPKDVRRALELKQQLSKTSNSKFSKMADAVCSDGRIKGVSQYYGAHTGRYAGRLVQMQNLTKNKTSDIEELITTRDLVKKRDLSSLRLMFGENTANVLSSLIRTTFTASEGNRLVVADFHSIEAAVIGWLAGEEWVNETFRGDGKIYEATAAQMFNVPKETIVKGNPNYSLRQKGKVATLALGYQGGVGALKAMGALNMGIPEEDLPGIVQMWRNANPHIVKLWYGLEDAAIKCMETGKPQIVRCVKFERQDNALTIELPVGRKLYYVNPSLKLNDFDKPALHYWAVNTGTWSELETYGGKLTENVVQALARDCLADALMRLNRAGIDFLFHVHDEVICDIPKADTTHDLKWLCETMAAPYTWAPGLKLSAAGFEAPFYIKD